MMIKELNSILDGVCRELNVDVEAVKGKNRVAQLINARRHYIHLARKHTNYGLADVAKIIFRTHAMSLHHEKKHQEFLETDGKYARDAFALESKAVPQYMIDEDSEMNMIDKLLVRNSYLQAELLSAKHELSILKLRKVNN